MEDPADVEKYLQNEPDVVDTLLEDYVDKVEIDRGN